MKHGPNNADPEGAPRELFDAVMATPFGALGIRVDATSVDQITYLPADYPPQRARSALAKEAVRQIRRYLADPRAPFTLPVATHGSAFQQRVWTTIATIACGEVRSYGQIARQLQSAPRAVGQACAANWLPLIIPCHRVLAVQHLGGFGGPAVGAGADLHLSIKRWLLLHEGVDDARVGESSA